MEETTLQIVFGEFVFSLRCIVHVCLMAFLRFQFVTLMGLWIIPMALCVRNYWWRFVISWTIFSMLTVLVMRRAMAKPVAGTTPR